MKPRDRFFVPNAKKFRELAGGVNPWEKKLICDLPF
jgi:hypothetical protein